MEDLVELYGIDGRSDSHFSDIFNYDFRAFKDSFETLQTAFGKVNNFVDLINAEVERTLLVTLSYYKRIKLPLDTNIVDMLLLDSMTNRLLLTCNHLKSKYATDIKLSDQRVKKLPFFMDASLTPEITTTFIKVSEEKFGIRHRAYSYRVAINDLVMLCKKEIREAKRKHQIIYDIAFVEEKLKQYYINFVKTIGKSIERRFVQMAQLFKEERHKPLTREIWGKVLDVDDTITDLASMDEINNAGLAKYLILDDTNHLDVSDCDGWCARYVAKDYSQDGELFDFTALAENNDILYNSINTTNIDYFMVRIHFHNYVQCQLYPHLKKQYEDFIKNYPIENSGSRSKENGTKPPSDSETGNSPMDKFIIGIGDDKKANKKSFCDGMKAIHDNDAKARYVFRQIGKTISNWPSHSALKKEGLVTCAASTWSGHVSPLKS